ncbi:uncharacterized protein Z518_04054 [Rhinocladiella mackenziei CBS 650.93]|uniref:ADF-H domain-containing protein n=1 Tax=Rhinocladiella mackenziei CBS 650.93 TaxID=1442369 RepID=A0A0D2JAE1_9EURO|nr:uncharacterized protein Z518_04054 [Rhinocladiella mackenziei CBS 650.93]KIX06080.1 hypothetical protein Z518_04054 [Rhinocladiella mackenziei CBS 650.93]
MQSGISASADLHGAFTNFTSDSTLFCLPVTITSESLTSLPSIPFPSTSSTFSSSLCSLDSLLNPTTPLYLLLRKTPLQPELVAITYIPSRAPVRQKTLFASTRATLVRELGSEKFAEAIFLTEREEILDPGQWDERAGTGSTSASAAQASEGVDIGLLSTQERELRAVKRAEEEERHGTRGRDLMNEGGSGASWIGTRDGDSAATRSGVTMRITDEAKSAMAELTTASVAGGLMVQFGIDIPTESLTLINSKPDVAPDTVAGLIPADRPSYTFYTVPNSSGGGGAGSIFIYVCPGTSKIKERMMYASSRQGVLHTFEGEGGKVLRKLEAGDPEELGAGRLEEEVKTVSSAGAAGLGVGSDGNGDDSAPGPDTATPRSGFARPKRPGKR